MTTPLVLGGGVVDRRVGKPADLLRAFREKDDGAIYLDRIPGTPPDRVVPEDLAVTLLINSRVDGRAYKAVLSLSAALDLSVLPPVPLEATSPMQRHIVAGVIAQVAQWPGFASSVATKVLHKKRPGLIPLLDNQAIFGAYMNPRWPDERSSQDSVKDLRRIRDALERIAFDLTRSDNASVWPSLRSLEPTWSLIEVLDSVWWMYFRSKEPRLVPAPMG